MPILFAVAAALVIMLGSLSGILFVQKTLGRWMRGRLTYLATFSAGVLTILAYHLMKEAFASSAEVAAASVVAGAVILEIIHHALPESHHHHEATGHTHTAVDGRRVLLSDAIHNVTDGFIIVPAFLIDWRIGLAATVSIFFHELVQEISEFFVLKEAGYSDRKALSLNFLTSSTILVGVGIAFVFASLEGFLAILSGLAAGGFLSVVIHDLLPNAALSARAHKTWTAHILAALLGAGLLLALTNVLPHEDTIGPGLAQNEIAI